MKASGLVCRARKIPKNRSPNGQKPQSSWPFFISQAKGGIGMTQQSNEDHQEKYRQCFYDLKGEQNESYRQFSHGILRCRIRV